MSWTCSLVIWLTTTTSIWLSKLSSSSLRKTGSTQIWATQWSRLPRSSKAKGSFWLSTKKARPTQVVPLLFNNSKLSHGSPSLTLFSADVRSDFLLRLTLLCQTSSQASQIHSTTSATSKRTSITTQSRVLEALFSITTRIKRYQHLVSALQFLPLIKQQTTALRSTAIFSIQSATASKELSRHTKTQYKRSTFTAQLTFLRFLSWLTIWQKACGSHNRTKSTTSCSLLRTESSTISNRLSIKL